ncbi:hypothetical protein [Draconibacterium mangrovi]|uniref:hypothetical protein n=1 Tax=Draconibacterium mangrovi TaxID=2697469 RepID=UPI0013D3AA5F|nr:hypothetical protein [Draconibacterium mangrovi]
MSCKKIAIIGAGQGLRAIAMGLQTGIAPHRLTNDDLTAFVKQVFSNNSVEPRRLIIGPDFAPAYRKEHGDDEFYELVTSKHIQLQCGEETYNYIMDFVKWYELKDSQRNKPKLKNNGSNNLHKTGKV